MIHGISPLCKAGPSHAKSIRIIVDEFATILITPLEKVMNYLSVALRVAREIHTVVNTIAEPEAQ
jgi:hypothetical protein